VEVRSCFRVRSAQCSLRCGVEAAVQRRQANWVECLTVFRLGLLLRHMAVTNWRPNTIGTYQAAPTFGQWNAALNCKGRVRCLSSCIGDVFLVIALVRHVLDWA
jgi:hypothetical protein